MEQPAQPPKGFQITIIVILLLALGNLAFLDWKLLGKNEPLTGVNPVTLQNEVEQALISQTCDKECLEKITLEVAKAVAGLPTPTPAKTETKVVTVEKTQKPQGTTYIPLNGTTTSDKSNWTDVSSSDVYIKAEDYGKTPYIGFEVSLKTTHEGGKVFVRLFDVTHGIAVDGSELSSSSTSFEQVSSGNLPFWAGNNLYRVQIKSLDNQPVTFASGRVKIVSK